MKLSDAMEAGYAKVGKQCFDGLHTDNPRKPSSVCAMAAVNLAVTGDAGRVTYLCTFEIEQKIVRWNNEDRKPIPEIVKILRGMGL